MTVEPYLRDNIPVDWDVAGPSNIVVGFEKPWLLINPDHSIVLYRRDGSEGIRLTEEQVFALIEGLVSAGERILYPERIIP